MSIDLGLDRPKLSDSAMEALFESKSGENVTMVEIIQHNIETKEGKPETKLEETAPNMHYSVEAKSEEHASNVDQNSERSEAESEENVSNVDQNGEVQEVLFEAKSEESAEVLDQNSEMVNQRSDSDEDCFPPKLSNVVIQHQDDEIPIDLKISNATAIPSDNIISVESKKSKGNISVYDLLTQELKSQSTSCMSDSQISKLPSATESAFFAESTEEIEIPTEEEDMKLRSGEELWEENALQPNGASFTSLVEKGNKRDSSEELLNELLESMQSEASEHELEHRTSSESFDSALEQLIERSRDRLLCLHTVEEEVGEKEEGTEKEIDRDLYYQMYDLYKGKLEEEKNRNMCLQKVMSAYYLRRKIVVHSYEESSQVKKEAIAMYEKDLYSFEKFYEESERQKALVSDEVKCMQMRWEEKRKELKDHFQKLQQAEIEYAKTLNLEQDRQKHIDRFIKRQRVSTSTLKEYRKAHIRLRASVEEKIKEIEHLEHLGLGFHVMDFVQLKKENLKLKNCLDDKLEELQKLRIKCEHHMQILAHNREKNQHLEDLIGVTRERQREVEEEHHELRQQVNYLRGELKVRREELAALKEEIGLLVHPKMLRDMERALDEVKVLRLQCEQVEKECHDKTSKMRMIRQNVQSRRANLKGS